MSENTNTNENVNLQPIDEYNGAMVTLPLSKLLQIVEERVEAKTLNDQWATKYWLLHAENEALKKKLQALEGES
jgi:hypothetical protein